jgi:hypothetical protein
VIDRRETIVAEISETAEVREYLAWRLRDMLEIQSFRNALPGYLLPDAASQARLPVLKERLAEIAGISA